MADVIVSIKEIDGDKKRIAAFLDDGSSVIMLKATAKEYSVAEGRAVSLDELKKIAKEGEEHIAFTTAIDSLSRSAKSKAEIYKLLKTKKFSKEAADSAVQKLIYYNYLGDDNYVRTYIDFKGQKTGRRKIVYDLVAIKGVDKSTAENIAYEMLPDDKEIEIARSLADKYLQKIKKKKVNFRDKTYCFLASRGFDSEIISSVIDEMKFNEEE